MKSRPILFSAPMVRALLADTKTKTRRICKPAEIAALSFVVDCGDGLWGDEEGDVQFRCPYGIPGDRLWVKETFRLFDSSRECACYDDCVCAQNHGKPVYRADSDSDDRWKPSIFMPRAASRLTLEITGVRVERLQSISEADAIAEGIERAEDFFGCPCWKCYGEDADVVAPDDPIGSYRSLWESINGPGSWDANPWVWVVEFKRANGGEG